MIIAAVVAAVALSCTTTTAASTRTVIVDGQSVLAEDLAKTLVDDADTAAHNNDWGRAKALYERVTVELADTTSYGPAAVALAHIDLDQGDARAAQAVLEKMLLADPTTPVADDARYLLALAQLQQGDSKSATPTLKNLVDKIPEAERGDALTKLGRQLLAQGQGTEAARYLGRALASPNVPDRAGVERDLVSAVDGMVPFSDLRVLLESEAQPNTLFDELLTMKLARVHLHLRDYASANDMTQRYLQRYPSGRYAAQATALRDQLAARVVVDSKVIGIILPLTGEYAAYGKRALSAVKIALGINVKAEAPPPEPTVDPTTGEVVSPPPEEDRPKKGRSLEETLTAPSGLKLVVRDSGGDADRAAAVVRSLVANEHAIAILGDILLDTSLPAALAAEDAGVPILSLSRRDGVPEAGPWSFRLGLTAKKQAKALVDLAVDGIGYKRFAIMYPKHPFGVELMNELWDQLEARQVEVTAVESYAHDQTTFTTEAKSLVGRGMTASTEVADCRRDAQQIDNAYRKKKALESCRDFERPTIDFEALFLPDSYKTVSYVVPALVAEDVLLTKDRRIVDNYKKTTGNDHVRPVQLFGVSMWNDPELVQRLGRHEIDGAIFVDGFDARSGEAKVQKFVQAFGQLHAGKPQLVEAQAYDGAALFAAILTGDGAPKNRDQFRQALQSTKDFPGVTGLIKFDDEGDSATIPRFFQVDGDRLEARDPAALAKAESGE